MTSTPPDGDHDHRGGLRGHRPGHDHDHDHEHSHRGLRGAARELFRPHGHDAADSVDSALEASERGIRVVKISFAALLLTSIAQLAVVVVTGSVALLADTIHNFSDALTAVPLFIAFRVARRPANRRYTYGYRRAEDFAGLFVIAMIALSAVVAAVEAVDRLFNPRRLDHIAVLLVAGLIGFLGNELVAVYRIREGTAIGSAALVADGNHARTDGFTSLAVAVGAIGVWAGYDRADPIVGLAISVAIFAVLRGAARQIWYRLMDAVDPAIIDRIEVSARTVHGVVGIHAVHARWLGHRLVAELDVAVDPSLSVAAGHAIAAEVSSQLLREVAHLDEARIHVDPDSLEPHEHARPR